MKYVIFKSRNLVMPIMFPEHVTHSQIKIEDAEVISAGFFKIDRGGEPKVILEQSSTSLDVKPRVEDENILRTAIQDFPTNFFLEL